MFAEATSRPAGDAVAAADTENVGSGDTSRPDPLLDAESLTAGEDQFPNGISICFRRRVAPDTFAKLDEVRATLGRRPQRACPRRGDGRLPRLVLAPRRGASHQHVPYRRQRAKIGRDRRRILVGHDAVVIGRMFGKPPAVGPEAFADRPRDFLIGPPSNTRFSIRRDVGRDRGRFCVQHISRPERHLNGYGGILVIERRMTPKASSDSVGEVSPSGNERTIADCLFGQKA